MDPTAKTSDFNGPNDYLVAIKEHLMQAKDIHNPYLWWNGLRMQCPESLMELRSSGAEFNQLVDGRSILHWCHEFRSPEWLLAWLMQAPQKEWWAFDEEQRHPLHLLHWSPIEKATLFKGYWLSGLSWDLIEAGMPCAHRDEMERWKGLPRPQSVKGTLKKAAKSRRGRTANSNRIL